MAVFSAFDIALLRNRGAVIIGTLVPLESLSGQLPKSGCCSAWGLSCQPPGSCWPKGVAPSALGETAGSASPMPFVQANLVVYFRKRGVGVLLISRNFQKLWKVRKQNQKNLKQNKARQAAGMGLVNTGFLFCHTIQNRKQRFLPKE